MESTAPTPLVRFGVYDLDLTQRELRKQGRRVALQDKPFEVLALLLERPGELVTREELQKRLWPGDTFVVFDDNLNTAVKKARDALGDAADGSRFIETVPRRGYRFIAPVERTSRLASDDGRSGAPPPVVSPSLSRWPDPAGSPGAGVMSRFRAWMPPTTLVAVGFVAGAVGAFTWRPAASLSPTRVRELTFSGADSEPASSPDGKLIAYTSSRNGIPRIWVKQLEGGEAPITEGPDRRPRFYPNGASLLFIRNDGGIDSAWRVPLPAGAPRLVIADVVEADPSPVDDRIAFIRLGHGDRAPVTTLGVTKGESGPERILLTLPNVELTSVRWSPDGMTIGAVRRSAAGTDTALILVDARSGAKRELSAGSEPGAFGALTWNGDGSTVLLTRSENAQVNMPGGLDRVVRYDLHANRLEDVLFAPNLFGPFRSVGNNSWLDVAGAGRLVFHTVETRENIRETPLSPSGSVSGRVHTSGNAQDRQPAYSPDGQTIVFTSNRSGNYDLWTMSTVTGQLHQFTGDTAQDRDPSFSADGQDLLWSSNRTGHLEIWRAHLDQTDQRQISHDGVDAENPTMGRNSQWVIYASRGNPEKEGIWRMKPDGSDATRLVAGDFSLPDSAPNGKYALYREIDRARQRNTIHVIQVEDSKTVPFEIIVPYRILQATENVTWGRARWTPDSKAIVFVGQDSIGRPSLFRQDFVVGQDTSPSRLRIVDALPGSATESFGLAPDGQWIAVADAFFSQSLMLADGLRGVSPPRR